MLVQYHASVTQQVKAPDANASACQAAAFNQQPMTRLPSCEPYVYDEGTLLVDLVDARTKKLVWRGWAEGGFNGALENQELLEARVDDSISRIFAKLPPRTAKTSARGRRAN